MHRFDDPNDPEIQELKKMTPEQLMAVFLQGGSITHEGFNVRSPWPDSAPKNFFAFLALASTPEGRKHLHDINHRFGMREIDPWGRKRK